MASRLRDFPEYASLAGWRFSLPQHRSMRSGIPACPVLEYLQNTAGLALTRSADKLSGTPLQLDSVGNPPGRRAKVLVVDDDPQVRALAARALTDAGFDVLEAADAVSALSLMQEVRGAGLSLIITDVTMPAMTGDEFGRLLRESRPRLPVLYMSGFSRPTLDFLSPIEVQHCWIEKPFSVQALVEKAQALCLPAHPLD